MNFAVRPLVEITDVDAAAHSLREHLADPANLDIRDEFPRSFERYSAAQGAVVTDLLMSQAACYPGKREHFVPYASCLAVGMAAVQIVGPRAVPEGVDPTWPNVGGFVCQPWRGRGLGTMLWKACLRSVHDEFGGNAWTLVRPNNIPSQITIQRVGFHKIGEMPPDDLEGPRDILIYQASEAVA